MSPSTSVPGGESRDQASDHTLSRAAEQLRGRTRQRAVEIADDVLLRALRTPRRSLPVRALGQHDYIRISNQVIISTLRRHIDDLLPDASVGSILLNVTRDQQLTAVTVELYARYGTVLLDVADQAREVTDQMLHRLLGPEAAADIQTSVINVRADVHVGDVTVGDPHLVDPRD